MRITFFLCLLGTLLTSYAQKVTVEWSPEIEADKKVRLGQIVYATDKDYYITKIKRDGRSYDLESFDKFSRDFKVIFSKSLAILSDQDFYLDDILYAKDKFLLFVHKYEKKIKTTTYYTTTVDMKGNINMSMTQIAHYDENSQMTENIYNNIYFSSDTSHFAMVVERSMKASKKAKEIKSFNLIVLDNNGKKIWDKIVQLPSKNEREIDGQAYMVGNDGTIYLLCKEYLENEKNKPLETIKEDDGTKHPGYIYKLFSVSNNGTSVKPYEINLENNYINSADLLNAKNGNIVVSGFYNNEKTNRGKALKGIFYFEIDKAGNIAKRSNYDFKDEFIDQFKANKLVIKKGGDESIASAFKVREILEREDGGKYLIAEYHVVVWVTVKTQSGYYSYPVYYYKDMIISSIAPDGSLSWCHRIGKNQRMANINKYMSYKAMVSNNKLYVIFNDDPDNAENDDDSEKSDMMGKVKKSAAALQIIDTNGKVVKQNLFMNSELETILDPRQCMVLDNNTMILVAEKLKGNDLKIGRMIIK